MVSFFKKSYIVLSKAAPWSVRLWARSAIQIIFKLYLTMHFIFNLKPALDGRDGANHSLETVATLVPDLTVLCCCQSLPPELRTAVWPH